MEAHVSSLCSGSKCENSDKKSETGSSKQMVGSNGLKEAGRVHCSDPSSRIGLCSHTPGAQVVADIDGARLVHGGGAMVVDAVMSLVVSASAMQ